jgi:hypothetical protein
MVKVKSAILGVPGVRDARGVAALPQGGLARLGAAPDAPVRARPCAPDDARHLRARDEGTQRPSCPLGRGSCSGRAPAASATDSPRSAARAAEGRAATPERPASEGNRAVQEPQLDNGLDTGGSTLESPASAARRRPHPGGSKYADRRTVAAGRVEGGGTNPRTPAAARRPAAPRLPRSSTRRPSPGRDSAPGWPTRGWPARRPALGSRSSTAAL